MRSVCARAAAAPSLALSHTPTHNTKKTTKNKLLLCGQTPDAVVAAAAAALAFHGEQARLTAHERVKRAAERRVKRTETACRAQLEKIHAAYREV